MHFAIISKPANGPDMTIAKFAFHMNALEFLTIWRARGCYHYELIELEGELI